MCNEIYAEFGHIAAHFFLMESILQLTTIEKINLAQKWNLCDIHLYQFAGIDNKYIKI